MEILTTLLFVAMTI
ncbi:hypothetical protein ES724_11805 [Gillisia hiemivivida]|uniref:Uncharacterized protein n=1 Tax=Gillisia hiemivivida TaxID=291190 RepID=A0A5C6ZRT2_9FLAO|nr:hypothetical protein ES724_11805 [Gillisia hiemivivida]